MADPWANFPIVEPAAPPRGADPWAAFPIVEPAANAAPEPDPTFGEQVFSAADSGVRGAGYLSQQALKGVSAVLGFPVDAINASPMLANLLPGEQGMEPFSEDPVGGSDFIYDAIMAPRNAVQSLAGQEVGDQTTDSPSLEFAGRVAEELGAASIPIAGQLNRGLRLGVEGTRRAQQGGSSVSRAFARDAERYAVNPGKTVAKEAAAATAAGTGAAAGLALADDGDDENVSTGEALADLFGSVLGYGAAEVGMNTGKGLNDVMRAITGNDRYASNVANDTAVSSILQASGATPNMNGAVDAAPLAARLRGRTDTAGIIPGFQDSVADRTGNAGLASLEYGRQSGPNAGMFVQRRTDNIAATSDKMADLAPEVPPSEFRGALERGAQESIDEADLIRDAAFGDLDAATRPLDSTMSGEQRGQVVRGALGDALEEARAVESDAWSAVGGEVDPAGLAARFDAVSGRLTEAERRQISSVSGAVGTPGRLVPEGDEDMFSAILGPDGRPYPKPEKQVAEMTDLAEVTTLRSELTDAARKARGAGEVNQARLIDQYVAEIDGFLDDIPEIAEPLEQARAVSRDLNDRFTRPNTPTARTLARSPGGGFAATDSSVSPQFVQPDEKQASNIERLLTETKDAAEVRDAIQDQILADVRGKNLLENPDGLEDYLGRYSQVFEKFPELKKDLGTVAGLQRTAGDAEGVADTTRKSLSPGGNSPTGRYLRFGAEDPARSMRTVIGDAQPREAVRELLRVSGDSPQAREGLRAAFWSELEAKARPVTMSNRVADGAGGMSDPWNFTTVLRKLDDPSFRAVAEELYADNPEALENLREVAETVRSSDLRETAKARMSSGTPQALKGDSIMPSTETLGAYSFAVQRGQIGLPFVGLRIGATMARNAIAKGREKQFNAVLDQLLLDPDKAALLLEEYNPATAEVLSRWAKGWAGAQAPEIIDLIESMGEDPDEDGQMMDAIMGGGGGK